MTKHFLIFVGLSVLATVVGYSAEPPPEGEIVYSLPLAMAVAGNNVPSEPEPELSVLGPLCPPPTEDLALALGRVCVNEANWRHPNDCAAIWQVTRNVRSRSCDASRFRSTSPTITQCRYPNGTTVSVERGQVIAGAQETELSALRRLSKRVTRMYPPTHRRQRWTSTLQSDGSVPTGWVECDAERLPRGCHGRWVHYREQSMERLTQARRLVSGELRSRPCPVTVIAWGGDMDRWIAKQRGLEEVTCDDTENSFWRRPRRDG